VPAEAGLPELNTSNGNNETGNDSAFRKINAKKRQSDLPYIPVRYLSQDGFMPQWLQAS
jgi:hypothetical protein